MLIMHLKLDSNNKSDWETDRADPEVVRVRYSHTAGQNIRAFGDPPTGSALATTASAWAVAAA